MGECKICGEDAQLGLTLVDEVDIAKHYGEFCKECYEQIDDSIEHRIKKMKFHRD